jgi:hypothetical protein
MYLRRMITIGCFTAESEGFSGRIILYKTVHSQTGEPMASQESDAAREHTLRDRPTSIHLIVMFPN